MGEVAQPEVHNDMTIIILWLHLTSWLPCWWEEEWWKTLPGIWLYYYARLEWPFPILLAPTWLSYHMSGIKEYESDILFYAWSSTETLEFLGEC